MKDVILSSSSPVSVFQLIGNSTGLLKLQIAENYCSSSDEEAPGPNSGPPSGPDRRQGRDAAVRRGFEASLAREALSDDEELHGRRRREHLLLLGGPPGHARGNSADSTLTEGSAARPMQTQMQMQMQMQMQTQMPRPPPPPRLSRPKRPSPRKKAFPSHPQAKKASSPPSRPPPANKSRQVNLSGTEELHLTERDINSFLHPTLDELRKSIKLHNIKRGQVDVAGAVFRAVVGYLGTIEMPKNEKKKEEAQDALALLGGHGGGASASSSLLNIRNCIRRLRVEKKVHTTVLMCIFEDRVTLINHHGLKLAEYPAEEIAFCGMCTDDKRFFGLVTSRIVGREEEEEEEDADADDAMRGGGDEDEDDEDVGEAAGESSSCHVFMTETVSDPAERRRRAMAFHFDSGAGEEAEEDGEGDDGQEFPSDADPIIRVVMSVFGSGGAAGEAARGGVAAAAAAAASAAAASAAEAQVGGLSPAAASQRSVSSNGDSGIGYRVEDQHRLPQQQQQQQQQLPQQQAQRDAADPGQQRLDQLDEEEEEEEEEEEMSIGAASSSAGGGMRSQQVSSMEASPAKSEQGRCGRKRGEGGPSFIIPASINEFVRRRRRRRRGRGRRRGRCRQI